MLISEKQLAKRWGYAPATLRKWRVQGRGPEHVKINGFGVRYDLAVIEAYEQTFRRSHTSDTGEAA